MIVILIMIEIVVVVSGIMLYHMIGLSVISYTSLDRVSYFNKYFDCVLCSNSYFDSFSRINSLLDQVSHYDSLTIWVFIKT